MLAQPLLALGLLLAPVATAGSLEARDEAPTVSVKNGTYAGVHSIEYDQDYFLGVPYAQAPARFAVAEGLDSTWDDVRSADSYPPHCWGYSYENDGYEMSEDCLYLNVIRPAGIDSDASLPVAVWIYGGGLFWGGSADKRYNMSFIVENSVDMGTPVIGVSLNYRLHAFGFLGGKEAQDAGVANIGFRDQRLALQWVQENIGAFGGAPDKVTIFGESSGAESVTAQVFAYNGRDDGLFRGAIGQSGFGSMLPRLPGGYNATDTQQEVFDNFIKTVTPCASTAGTSQAIDCLREAPFEDIDAALNGTTPSGPWLPAIDGDFLADLSANQLARGDFVQVPLLVGANTDEGSDLGAAFGPNGGKVDTDDDMRWAVASVLSPHAEEHTGKPLEQFIDEALYVYPDIQAVGIPSLETWPHVIEPNDTFAETLGLQTRRAAAFFGDLWMHFPRRRANEAWSGLGVPSYAYRFDVTPYPFPPSAGAFHFQEIAFVFYNLNGDGYDENPFGGNDTEYSTKARQVAKTMSSAWINFIVSQDPNGDGLLLGDGKEWPIFDSARGGGVGREIVFGIDGAFVEMDDFRAEGINWLIENELALFGN